MIFFRIKLFSLGLLVSLVAALVVSLSAHAESWDALNDKVRELSEAGEYEAALAVAERMAEIALREDGENSESLASALNNIAAYNGYLGRHEAAEATYRRALATIEKAYGRNSEYMGMTLGNLGQLYTNMRRFEEAEPPLLRSIEIFERRRSRDAEAYATALANLGALYSDTGREVEAEKLHRRALEITEKKLGPDHPEIGPCLNNLAVVLEKLGRSEEAGPLYLRALQVTLKALGPKHPALITRYNNLAEFYRERGEYKLAEPLYRKSIALAEKAYGPDHQDVAMAKGNLAKLFQNEKRYPESEALLRESLEIREKVFGKDHPATGVALHNLATVMYRQGRYSDAQPLFSRALAMREQLKGPENSDLVSILSWLSANAYRLEQWDAGLEYARRAARIVVAQADRSAKSDRSSKRDYARSTLSEGGSAFAYVVEGAWRVSKASSAPQGALIDEAFQAEQLGNETSAAAALAQFTARDASGNEATAALARERQDLVARWAELDSTLLAGMATPASPAAETAKAELRKELAETNAKIVALDKKTAREFPAYTALMRPASVSIREAQKLLRPDEALFQLSYTDDGLFVWFVTAKQLGWSLLSESADKIDARFDALVCGLDSARWKLEGPRNCRSVLSNLSLPESSEGRALPFDAHNAYELYRLMFEQFEPALKNPDGSWKRLIIAPGAFASVPFQALVTEDPTPAKSAAGTDFRAVKWLGTRQAITVIPSIAGFKALRDSLPRSAALEPFLGFGNPLLDGAPGNALVAELAAKAKAFERCSAAIQIASADAGRELATVRVQAGLADVAQLKRQFPLPETAIELCEVAKSLGLSEASLDDSIWIGSKATESEVKALSKNGRLAKHRILHFATHGALAGQVQGSDEPGLIMTPPQQPSAVDDGYLTAAEIAQLKLNADWVILSACNTAGGAANNADALSGMARAFFYAGARSLLVSHWAVNSHATVKLITTAFSKIHSDPQIGRAEAMRFAMADLVAHGAPAEAHPSYWAPFSVVGEGGAAPTPQ